MSDQIINPKSQADAESAAREAWRAMLSLGKSLDVILHELDELYCSNPFHENPIVMARNCGQVGVCQYIAQRLAWAQGGDETPRQEQAKT